MCRGGSFSSCCCCCCPALEAGCRILRRPYHPSPPPPSRCASSANPGVVGVVWRSLAPHFPSLFSPSTPFTRGFCWSCRSNPRHRPPPASPPPRRCKHFHGGGPAEGFGGRWGATPQAPRIFLGCIPPRRPVGNLMFSRARCHVIVIGCRLSAAPHRRPLARPRSCDAADPSLSLSLAVPPARELISSLRLRGCGAVARRSFLSFLPLVPSP